MEFVPLPSGTILNKRRYRIERHLATGGQGAVYKAIDLHQKCEVAIKQVLLDSETADPAHEWKLLHKLSHPLVPEVFNHFSEYISGEKCGFLVMEFIPGLTLGDLLKRRGKPFPLHNVLEWADQLLGVLDTLHTQAQIIHRDIKPANLKPTRDGRIILLDFGIAKFVAEGTEFYGSSQYYSSPEQLLGRPTDARSDLYSLAATLYHFITGEQPNTAVGDKLKLPWIIADALQRALSLDPQDRFSTAREMREALFSYRDDDYMRRPGDYEYDIFADIEDDDPQSTPAERGSRKIEIRLGGFSQDGNRDETDSIRGGESSRGGASPQMTPDDQEQVISLERIWLAVGPYIKAHKKGLFKLAIACGAIILIIVVAWWIWVIATNRIAQIIIAVTIALVAVAAGVVGVIYFWPDIVDFCGEHGIRLHRRRRRPIINYSGPRFGEADPVGRHIDFPHLPQEKIEIVGVASKKKSASQRARAPRRSPPRREKRGLFLFDRIADDFQITDRSNVRKRRLKGAIGIAALAIIVVVTFHSQTRQLLRGLGRGAEKVWIYIKLDIPSFETEVNNGSAAEALENFIDKNRGESVWINTMIAVKYAEVTEGKNSTSLCVATAPLEGLQRQGVVPCGGFTCRFDGKDHKLPEFKGNYELNGYFVIDKNVSSKQGKVYVLTRTTRKDITIQTQRK